MSATGGKDLRDTRDWRDGWSEKIFDNLLLSAKWWWFHPLRWWAFLFASRWKSSNTHLVSTSLSRAIKCWLSEWSCSEAVWYCMYEPGDPRESAQLQWLKDGVIGVIGVDQHVLTRLSSSVLTFIYIELMSARQMRILSKNFFAAVNWPLWIHHFHNASICPCRYYH